MEIIERDGVTAVTFDAIATLMGITHGGLLYHFPSREELLLATHHYLADRWEQKMAELSPTQAATIRCQSIMLPVSGPAVRP